MRLELSYHSVAANSLLKNEFVQPREPIFMKNHNGNIFRYHFEFFNGGSWGAYRMGGGVGFILAYEAEGFTSFWGEIYFQGYRRGDHGRFSAYMVERRRAVGYTYGAFFIFKNAIFYLDVCLSMERRCPPPIRPLMNWFWKYHMWTSTRIKNH